MASAAALTLTFMVLASLNFAHFYVINVTTDRSTGGESGVPTPDSDVGDFGQDGQYESGIHPNDTHNSKTDLTPTVSHTFLQGNITISSSYSPTNDTVRSDVQDVNISLQSKNERNIPASDNTSTNSTCKDPATNCTTSDTHGSTSAAKITNDTVAYEAFKGDKTAPAHEGTPLTPRNFTTKHILANLSRSLPPTTTTTTISTTTTIATTGNTSQLFNQSAAITTTTKTPPTTTTTKTTTTTPKTTTTTTGARSYVKAEKGRKRPGKAGRKSSSPPKTSVSSESHHLAKHFTGFVQHVWLPNSTPRQPGPVDEGPFGSILWKDKKYLISVLIPIGVGFSGAMMIIVMAYASRAWRKRKERHAHEQGAPRSFLEAATSKNDDTAPLQESSDDEF